ncbi:hypothetical protein AC1031_010697 [Aphanomyces cochlioides]|nr:hypothetical protein AC1031_010697 [Aphanomyces cochlioides]
MAITLSFIHRLIKREKKDTKQPSTLKTRVLASSKCYPLPIPLPTCCQERHANHDAEAPDTAVFYKIIHKRALRREASIVGGVRVPFYPVHNACQRVLRKKAAVLETIAESDGPMCDACRAHHLSLRPACVSITL